MEGRRGFDQWFDFDSLDRPARLVDQYFGSGLDADEFFVPASRVYPRYRHHPARLVRPSSWAPEKEGGVAERKVSKDMFSVKLDVHQFTPEEISVKTKDSSLIIEAKHEEREDAHGFISRQFSRRYVLPEDVKVDQLICNMSSDGVLAIECPRTWAQQLGENVIPIHQTGRPAVVATPTTPTPTVAKGEDAPEPRSQNIYINRESAGTNANATTST